MGALPKALERARADVQGRAERTAIGEIAHRTFGTIIKYTALKHPGALNRLFDGLVLPRHRIEHPDFVLPPALDEIVTEEHARDCVSHYLGTRDGWGTLEDERILFRNGISATGDPLFPFEVGRYGKSATEFDAIRSVFLILGVTPYFGFALAAEKINARLNGVFDMLPQAGKWSAYRSLLPFIGGQKSIIIDIDYFEEYTPNIVGDLYTLGVLVAGIEAVGREDVRVEQLVSPFEREVELVKQGLPDKGVKYDLSECEFQPGGKLHRYKLRWRYRPLPRTVRWQIALEAYNRERHSKALEKRSMAYADAAEVVVATEERADASHRRALEEATKRAEDAEAHAGEVETILYMGDHEVGAARKVSVGSAQQAVKLIETLEKKLTGILQGIHTSVMGLRKKHGDLDQALLGELLDPSMKAYIALKSLLDPAPEGTPRAQRTDYGPQVRERIDIALRRLGRMENVFKTIRFYGKEETSGTSYAATTQMMVQALQDEVSVYNEIIASTNADIGQTLKQPISLEITHEYDGHLWMPEDGASVLVENLVRNSYEVGVTRIAFVVSQQDGIANMHYRDWTTKPMEQAMARAWEKGTAESTQGNHLGFGNKLVHRLTRGNIQVKPEQDGTSFYFQIPIERPT